MQLYTGTWLLYMILTENVADKDATTTDNTTDIDTGNTIDTTTINVDNANDTNDIDATILCLLVLLMWRLAVVDAGR